MVVSSAHAPQVLKRLESLGESDASIIGHLVNSSSLKDKKGVILLNTESNW